MNAGNKSFFEGNALGPFNGEGDTFSNRQETIAEIMARLMKMAESVPIPPGVENIPGYREIKIGKVRYFAARDTQDSPTYALIRLDIEDDIFESINPNRKRWIPVRADYLPKVFGYGGGDIWDEIEAGEALATLKSWGLENAKPGFLTQQDIVYSDPVLPNIRLTPKEMGILFCLLRRCKKYVQEMFRYLIENWNKCGYIVNIKPTCISLDIPFGDRMTSLAMLVPESRSQEWVAYPPVIILKWDALRKSQAFPALAIDEFQDTLRKSTDINGTKSFAYIEIQDWINPNKRRIILRALRTLAMSVHQELVEAPNPPGPGTEKNIERTIKQCPEHVQEIFNKLMDTWNAEGGTIQSRNPGRIYLRLKTKIHSSGWSARYFHNFALVVLSSGNSRNPAHLQIAWNLSRSKYCAYLDCVPDEVARFEEVVQSLPGFERTGCITYLRIGNMYPMEYIDQLCRSLIRLKHAEQSAL